jgi:SRSO17 transposase
MVSLTLARREVPVPIALQLYLPEDWAQDEERRAQAKVPESIVFEPKGNIALALIDTAIADGVRFGIVLADAGFGSSAAFRAALTERGLLWAVGVLPAQLVYPADVELIEPTKPALGRPAKHPTPSVDSVQAQQMIEGLDARRLRRYAWRNGTKGMLTARFAAVRVRAADGPLMAHERHLPGQAVWLVCEVRDNGERKYYFTNHSDNTPRMTLVRAIKARWVCEQGHQQMKDELGLDHYEGRSWLGLHHHALLTMMALAYLQHRRLACTQQSGEKTSTRRTRPATAAIPTRRAARHHRYALPADLHALPSLRRRGGSASA